MTQDYRGGCRCGQLRYRIAQDGPLLNYICHCLDCQKSTASAFADQLIIAVDALETEGRSITVEFPRPTGAVSTHHHCPDCLSRVYNLNSMRPGIAIVRAGTLDDPSPLEPFAHLWVKRKRGWVAIPHGVAIFEENPDPAAFMALAMARRG